MSRTRLRSHNALRAAGAAGAAAALLALAGCGADDTPDAVGATGSTAAATTSSATMADKTATSSMTDKATASMTKATSTMTGKAMTAGYVTLAEYQTSMADYNDTKVVMFFHAPWCPSCKATDESLTSAGVPDGLTVVKVDYDSETELRKKYKVTQQHTFVEVAPDQMALTKWTGSTSGADILAKVS